MKETRWSAEVAEQLHLWVYEENDVTHKVESSPACENGHAASDAVGMMGMFAAAEVGGADTTAVHIEASALPYVDGNILDNMDAVSYSAAWENRPHHVVFVVEV